MTHKAFAYKQWIQYFGFYLFCAGVGGSLIPFTPDSYGIFVLLFSLLLLFIRKGKKSKRYFLLFLSITISMVVTVIYTNGALSLNSSGSLISRYILLYALIYTDSENFIRRFLKFAYFIAFVSLIALIVNTIIGFDKMFTIGIPMTDSVRNLVLFNISNIHFGKNIGIFNEPGQYQIFLSAALFLAVFFPMNIHKNKRTRYIIVLVATILTTQSTAGVLILVGFFLAFVIKSNISYKQKLLVFAVGSIFLILVLFFINKDSSFYYNFIGKILTSSNTIDLSLGSAGARTSSILFVLEYIIDHPLAIFGIGYETLDELGMQLCASLLGTLLTYGIITWSIIYGNIVWGLWKSRDGIVMFLLGVYIVLVAGLSQPNILNPFLLVMSIAPFFTGMKRKQDWSKQRFVQNHRTG